MSVTGPTCDRCGALNPPGFRYCGSCATALPTDSGPDVGASGGPCWRCQLPTPAAAAWCPACGATLGTGAAPPPPAPAGPLRETPPGGGVEVVEGPEDDALGAGLVTALLALTIIIVLAIIGIVAGRAVGG